MRAPPPRGTCGGLMGTCAPPPPPGTCGAELGTEPELRGGAARPAPPPPSGPTPGAASGRGPGGMAGRPRPPEERRGPGPGLREPRFPRFTRQALETASPSRPHGVTFADEERRRADWSALVNYLGIVLNVYGPRQPYPGPSPISAGLLWLAPLWHGRVRLQGRVSSTTRVSSALPGWPQLALLMF